MAGRGDRHADPSRGRGPDRLRDLAPLTPTRRPRTCGSPAGSGASACATNRERTIPHGFDQLGQAGNLATCAWRPGAHGRYRALGEAIGVIFPFLDTDVYKWLEAVGWELGREPDPRLRAMPTRRSGWWRRRSAPTATSTPTSRSSRRGSEYQDLAWGHELYCVGHLIQAAVAWQRALGDDRLLGVAIRAADAVDRELGPAGRVAIDGHPEIEMALVELYRITGERRYLELAARFVEARGDGLLGTGRFGPAYWQDHAPRARCDRRWPATPSASCTSTAAPSMSPPSWATTQLLDAVERRWRDMVATRMYLTGGLGSRHRDEAFGDPYELPPDRRLRRDVRLDRQRHARLAAAPRDRRPAITPTSSSGPIYNGVLPGALARRHASSSTSTPCSGGRTARRRTTAERRARSRGTPAPVARPTSCAC